ncbi:unnamed protein product [Adineta steineri]|uniref:Eukaryotic translation initiation factor 5 n=1 Tax=Adineta steineri TaxID=433720 RepID=A0A815THL6_9BILA|nr:unnamed protein product [Adineta steineri]CAF1187246.1 unnamed protein product [Adineta steineri]CAF1503882.1 unnamed protein product [Adineta steineri]CAF3606331.1 unnamed protein product [Adineta steineri]CAF3869158.1 unnamed protein product [Adineta steineri]
MAFTNINRKIKDPYNRYKMPKLIVQVAIERYFFKTILVNISAVGKALHRSPLYIIKYLSLELNSSMKFDKQLNEYVIIGNYNPEILQDSLDGFINQFVLCRICENPETDLDYDQRNPKEIYQRCFACGNTSEIRIESHKLVKFICKNWSKDEKNNNQYNWNKMKTYDEEEKNIFFDDISIDDDLFSLEINDEQFILLLRRKKLLNQLNDSISIEELINEAKRLNIITKVPYLIVKNLFTNEILKEIDKYETLLLHFCQNNDEGQYSLLDGIAMFICSNEEIHEKFSNEKQISTIFYKLYEKDLVNEDVFYDWYEKESNRMIQKTIETDIHEYAKRFIQWLRTAEETDDDNQY